MEFIIEYTCCRHTQMHFQKIKLDCNYMRVNNKNLKNEIKLKIINKFGQNISLNKLYETILRRIVYDIKANLNETTTYFTKQIKGKLYIYVLQ